MLVKWMEGPRQTSRVVVVVVQLGSWLSGAVLMEALVTGLCILAQSQGWHRGAQAWSPLLARSFEKGKGELGRLWQHAPH